MTRSSVHMTISPLGIALIAIATIAASVLASLAAVSWWAEPADPETVVAETRDGPVLTSGMTYLNAHQCKKAETKQIILGGVEDNYLVGGEEPIRQTDLHFFVQERLGPKGALTVDRSYDEPGVDRFFLDSFQLPTNITSGVFVLRAASVSSETNDSFNIGDISAHWGDRNGHPMLFAKVDEDAAWENSNDIFAANLAEMAFMHRERPDGLARTAKAYSSLLTFIQGGEGATRKVDVLLGDDHVVDFVGFAVCLPPIEEKGLTFMAFEHPANPQYLSMSCAGEDNVMVCNPHAGDTLCSAALPLACMKPGREPVASGFPQRNAEKEWTGGRVAFTQPIEGQSIATSADAHAMCESEFGEGFRAATSQERARTSSYIAKGKAPPTGRAWVHSKTEKYANCWALDDANEGVAQ